MAKRFLIISVSILMHISCINRGNRADRNSFNETQEHVSEVLSMVNNRWQSLHDPEDQNAFWHHSAYHIGNLAAFEVTENSAYLDYTLKWAEHNKWMGATSTDPENWKSSYGETNDYVLFGDWQACFQVYIDLYKLDPDSLKIARTLEVMQYQVKTEKNDYLFWVDGLFMVMPVMTRLYGITEDTLYLSKLYEYYRYTKDTLFDNESGLFYRDAKYIYPAHSSLSGKKDFWSRGNGWAFAALARVMDDLPVTHRSYDDYASTFRAMAAALKVSQQDEGYWTRSLLDPEHAPGPETSGTAFNTYGILWGLNNGLLDRRTYLPVVKKSWHYLTKTALQADGSLGYVQPIGEKAIPGQVVDAQSEADFGVGAFLLAGTELVNFLGKK